MSALNKHMFALIVFVFYAQLLHQALSQNAPEDICVSGAVDNFVVPGQGTFDYTAINGEYELEGQWNGFPYYKKDEGATQYLFAGYWPPDDIYYYLLHSDLTMVFPDLPPNDTDVFPVECSGPQDWNITPSDPTQCQGGWVIYYNDTIDFDFNVTDVTVVSGECESGDDDDDDDSDSDSDSDSNDAAAMAIGSRLNGDNNNEEENNGTTEQIVISFSKNVMMNIWALVIGFLVIHVVIAWCYCFKSKKTRVTFEDQGGSRV